MKPDPSVLPAILWFVDTGRKCKATEGPINSVGALLEAFSLVWLEFELGKVGPEVFRDPRFDPSDFSHWGEQVERAALGGDYHEVTGFLLHTHVSRILIAFQNQDAPDLAMRRDYAYSFFADRCEDTAKYIAQAQVLFTHEERRATR